MPLPTKSRYTIAEAAKFIAEVTGKTVTLSEVLDWGSQRLYKIYLPLKWGTVRQVGKPDITHINDSIVEIRLSSGQAAILGKGERVGFATCWLDGIECNFVRQRGVSHNPHIPMRSGSNWRTDTANWSAAGLVLLGDELDAFTASIAKPQQTAPATDTAPEQSPATPAPVEDVGASDVWWKIENDIFDMAQNIGASLKANRNPHSNTKIGEEIAKRIKAMEQKKGKSRNTPSASTVRKMLNGWSIKPD